MLEHQKKKKIRTKHAKSYILQFKYNANLHPTERKTGKTKVLEQWLFILLIKTWSQLIKGERLNTNIKQIELGLKLDELCVDYLTTSLIGLWSK